MQRHPHAIFLSALATLSGATLLMGREGSPLESTLPHELVDLWAVMLVATGAITFVGSCMRDRLTGLLLERAAQTPLGVLALVYALVAFAYVEQFTIVFVFPIAVTIGFGIACIARVIQIHKTLRRYEDELRAAHDHE